ncbi:hypothetical protein BDZ97DRAFT_1959789 [Flammula alnicola]|nr:hypothetical protein BDZ97DRAFT_1959789 [Flammula alnicola]
MHGWIHARVHWPCHSDTFGCRCTPGPLVIAQSVENPSIRKTPDERSTTPGVVDLYYQPPPILLLRLFLALSPHRTSQKSHTCNARTKVPRSGCKGDTRHGGETLEAGDPQAYEEMTTFEVVLATANHSPPFRICQQHPGGMQKRQRAATPPSIDATNDHRDRGGVFVTSIPPPPHHLPRMQERGGGNEPGIGCQWNGFQARRVAKGSGYSLPSIAQNVRGVIVIVAGTLV